MHRFFSKSWLVLPCILSLVLAVFPSVALDNGNLVVIINSGATNLIGYRIYLSPLGRATYIDGRGQGEGRISTSLTQKFFRDIGDAMPLSGLVVNQPCIKPVSFGTSTTIKLGEQQSPDISCPGNAKVEVLHKDTVAIVRELKVRNIPRFQGHELPPQQP